MLHKLRLKPKRKSLAKARSKSRAKAKAKATARAEAQVKGMAGVPLLTQFYPPTGLWPGPLRMNLALSQGWVS